MMSKTPLNVQSFPRPPRVERTPRHLQIKYKGEVIADTTEAYWVLETHHPPTYYLPPSSVKLPLTKTARTTWCEWKGTATYFSLSVDGQTVSNRIWTYEQPMAGFEAIRGFLSFYAGPWDCFVDGEQVVSQPGDFYGGWVTSELQGTIKGRMGHLDPIL